MEKGKFIVFEGLDGCGKTTQIDRLISNIDDTIYNVKEFSNISKGPIGLCIRELTRNHIYRNSIFDFQLACLYASELMLIANEIKTLLDNGTNVICSRWFYSTLAYAGKNPLVYDKIKALYADILIPDIVIYLEIEDVDITMDRISIRNGHKDVFENKEHLSSTLGVYNKVFADDDILEPIKNILYATASDDANSISSMLSYIIINNFGLTKKQN